MRLRFLGTRGEIDARSSRHKMHTALLVSWRGLRIMIDCGVDWLGRVRRVNPDAIVLTHAHRDHAGGLRNGAPCPVYATEETWDRIVTGPIPVRRIIAARKPFRIGGIRWEAFSLEHSLRAPAVGYRITPGHVSVFYAPDVVSIHDRYEALRDVEFYIGDGASITRSLYRRRGGKVIGHSSIQRQLQWCREEGVRRAIFTHCGTQIVAGDEPVVREQVETLGRRAGVEVRIATDGWEPDWRSGRTESLSGTTSL